MKILSLFFSTVISCIFFISCGQYWNNGTLQTSKTNSIYFMSNSATNDLINTMGICPYHADTGKIDSNCNIPPVLNEPGIPSSYTASNGRTYMYIPNTAGNNILICPLNSQGSVDNCRDAHVPLAVSPQSITIYTLGSPNPSSLTPSTYAYISNPSLSRVVVCRVQLEDGSLFGCQDSGYQRAVMQVAGYYASGAQKNYLIMAGLSNPGTFYCSINSNGTINPLNCGYASTSSMFLTGAAVSDISNKAYFSSLSAAALFTCSLNPAATTASTLFPSGCVGPTYAMLSNPGGLFLDSTKSILYVSNTTNVQSRFLTLFSLSNSGLSGPYAYVPLSLSNPNITTTVGGITFGTTAQSSLSGTTIDTMVYMVGKNNNVYSFPLSSQISSPSQAITSTPGSFTFLNIPRAGSVYLGQTSSNLIYPSSFYIDGANNIHFSYGTQVSNPYAASVIRSTTFSLSQLSNANDSTAVANSYTINPSDPLSIDSAPSGNGVISGQIRDSATGNIYLVGNTGNGSSISFRPFAQMCFPLPSGSCTALIVPGLTNTNSQYATEVTIANGYVYFVLDQYNAGNGSVIKCRISSLPAAPDCSTLAIPNGFLYNPQSIAIFNGYAYITNLGALLMPPTYYLANILFPYTEECGNSFLTVCKLNSSGDVSNAGDCQMVTTATTNASGVIFPSNDDSYSFNSLAVAPSTNPNVSAYLLLSNMADAQNNGSVLSCPIPNTPIPASSGLLPLNNCSDSGAPLSLGVSASKIQYY